jgi:hypothetical protein
MPELERELRALGAQVDLPAERDLVLAVRTRLSVQPRRRRWLRPLAVALAVLALALGIALAVPPARSSILRFFGLESVTVIRVDTLPPAGTGPLAFGRRLPLATAERQAGFRPLLPDLGDPDAVYLSTAGDYLIMLYGRPPTRLRLAETRTAPGLITKLVHFGGVEAVDVGGARGVWFEGPHVVVELTGQPRLATSALLWERNGLLLRLEGKLTKQQALQVARSVR